MYDEKRSSMNVKASILIADDNGSFSRSLSLILVHKGYEVSTVESGPKAIEEIKRRLYDITFMDIEMPEMDGLETVKLIREIRPEAKVVMMTGFTFEEREEKALQEGVIGVIYKPLDIDKVIAIVERALPETVLVFR